MKEKRLEPLGLTLYEETFPSGMKAFVLKLPGFKKTYATLGAHYGSVDSAFVTPSGEEQQVPDGIAHFLEHKLFEEEDGSVMDRFSELGAFSNAYTNYTSTTYLFSATERIDENLELLVDFVQKPWFTAESVEKEQGIIGQELRMYEDDPGWRVFHNVLSGLFVNHPVRIDIGGTVESIREITPQLLFDCHKTFYHPSNLVFFAVGDLEPQKVFATVGRHLKTQEPGGTIRRLRPPEPKEVHASRVEVRMPVGIPLIELGFKDKEGKPDLRREVATSLMLEAFIGRSTSLFTDLYAKGLLTDRFSAQYFTGEDFAATLMGGDTPDPDGLLAAIQEGIREARRTGIDKEVIERCRRRQIGEYIAIFDSPEAVAHAFVDTFHKGQDLFAFQGLLQSVTGEEVMDRLSHLADDNWTVSIVRPLEAATHS